VTLRQVLAFIRESNQIAVKHFFVALCFQFFLFSTATVTLCQLGSASSSSKGKTATSKIITGTSVRVRSEPKLSGKEVATLNLGAIVKSTEKSSTKDKIGQKEDFWYKITTQDKKSGWVFGGFLINYEEAKRETIYLKIATERLKLEDADFGDYSDLYNFLARINSQVKTQAVVAELELYKFQALAKALEKIPFDKQTTTPYSDFIKNNESKIAYSEPAGQYYVRADLLWNLSARYRTLSIGERIAWAASQTPIPGECEGDISCHLIFVRRTNGEYLKLYPSGGHAKDSLQQMSELFAPIVADLSNKETYMFAGSLAEKQDARKTISEIRTILRQVEASPSKDIVMNQLDQIYKAFQ